MKKKENVKNLIIALVFGIVAFIVLLVINNRISQNEVDMIWAVKEIPQGTTLTEGNIDSYVSAKPTNDSIKNADIIVEKKQLLGMTALRKSQVLNFYRRVFSLKVMTLEIITIIRYLYHFLRLILPVLPMVL